MTNFQYNQSPNGAWIVQAWVSFAVSLSAMLLGAVYLELEPWVRAFIALGTLYLATSCFTLAKTVRDQQEAGRIVSRVDEAKIEKLLSESGVASF